MLNTFETKDFATLTEFIKPLLKEGYDVKIVPDCEGVYIVEWINRKFSACQFMLYDEEKMTLDGEPIEWIYTESEGMLH